jgi:hypothetical protein
MGFTPQDLNAMSPWQWAAAAEGYMQAHSSEEDRKNIQMTEDEFAMAARQLEG